MQITVEFKIEGLQNFEQYSKINPISVQIIDPDLQTKLLFYSKKYYLVLQLKKTQKLFLSHQMA